MPPVDITLYTTDRPLTYDPNQVWSRSAQLWGAYPAILKVSDGRYKNSLIVIGIDVDGLGVISNA